MELSVGKQERENASIPVVEQKVKVMGYETRGVNRKKRNDRKGVEVRTVQQESRRFSSRFSRTRVVEVQILVRS